MIEHRVMPFASAGLTRCGLWVWTVGVDCGCGLLRHVGAFPQADMSACGKAGTCPAQSEMEPAVRLSGGSQIFVRLKVSQ
jgi:hypothetical protein